MKPSKKRKNLTVSEKSKYFIDSAPEESIKNLTPKKNKIAEDDKEKDQKYSLTPTKSSPTPIKPKVFLYPNKKLMIPKKSQLILNSFEL